ncbi:TPA: hypothetical protein ACKQEX_003754 [Serratia marcescens]|uniref:hypothetical protein n=1 Tax=Serratia marcescens TaxID=615 RepID=UPI001EF8D4EA|nr:hypothetical protein [Serratia marcescens]
MKKSRFTEEQVNEAKTIFPDVIVHRRVTRQNHLVLEFKKSTSLVDRQIDLRKLRGYKQQLGYEQALFVEMGLKDNQLSRLERQ